MKKLKAFARLAPNDRVLLLRAFAYLASSNIRLRFQRFEDLQAWATEIGHGKATVDRISWAINIAMRLMPGSTCLCHALTLQRLLAFNGHNSELRIGARKSNDDFRAHAWLLHNDRVLIGDSQLEDYEWLVARESGSVAPNSNV